MRSEFFEIKKFYMERVDVICYYQKILFLGGFYGEI